MSFFLFFSYQKHVTRQSFRCPSGTRSVESVSKIVSKLFARYSHLYSPVIGEGARDRPIRRYFQFAR